MIYLGPDDRHPRALYWGVLVVLVLDFTLSLYGAYRFREVDPGVVYYHRIAMGTVVRVVVPAAVLAAAVSGAYAWVRLREESGDRGRVVWRVVRWRRRGSDE